MLANGQRRGRLLYGRPPWYQTNSPPILACHSRAQFSARAKTVCVLATTKSWPGRARLASFRRGGRRRNTRGQSWSVARLSREARGREGQQGSSFVSSSSKRTCPQDPVPPARATTRTRREITIPEPKSSRTWMTSPVVET